MVTTGVGPFGIVSVEVIASGAPVLAAKTGGVPEIINSPEIGRLVSDFTPAAFARTMLEVLTLPDRGGVMAAKAQESVGQRFDSPVISEKFGIGHPSVALELVVGHPSGTRSGDTARNRHRILEDYPRTGEYLTDLSEVPEPTTLLLFSTTMAGLGMARWRRRRQS